VPLRLDGRTVVNMYRFRSTELSVEQAFNIKCVLSTAHQPQQTTIPSTLQPAHLEQRPVSVLLWHLEGEVLHHGLLQRTHNLKALALLQRHRLLVLGIDDGLELTQLRSQLVQQRSTLSLRGNGCYAVNYVMLCLNDN
jgi:hypothetical protein